jgi:hypothetical protein
MKYVSWVAHSASIAAGAKRIRRLPPWLRSLRRSGPGIIRHATSMILGDIGLMDVLG